MSLDLSPEVEDLLRTRAQAAGTSASEYVARLLQAETPVTPSERVRALVDRWQAADHTPRVPPPAAEEGRTPSEVLFRQWSREDADLSAAVRAEAEELWRQFQRGIDAERAAAGMRTVF